MKQSGSMASFSSYRMVTDDLKHERLGRTRRFAMIFGAATCSILLVGQSSAAPQTRPIRGAPAPALLDTVKDRDGDGLDNSLELGQSSALDRVDTDNDGWNDAEE